MNSVVGSPLNGEYFVWQDRKFHYHGNFGKIVYEDIADKMSTVPITDEKYLKLLGVKYKVINDKAVILGDGYAENEITLPTCVWREDLKRYVSCSPKTHTAIIVNKDVVSSSLAAQKKCLLDIELLKASEKIGDDAGMLFGNSSSFTLSNSHCVGEKEINGKKYFLFRFEMGFVLFKYENFRRGIGNLLVPKDIPIRTVVGKGGKNPKIWAAAMNVNYIHVVHEV